MGRQQEASKGERSGQQVSGRSRPRLARVGRGHVSQNLVVEAAGTRSGAVHGPSAPRSAQQASPVQGDKRLDGGPRARFNDHTPGGTGLGPGGLWARARDECGGGGVSRERLAAGDHKEDCRAFYCICKLCAPRCLGSVGKLSRRVPRHRPL